jgi:hypothetical protein
MNVHNFDLVGMKMRTKSISALLLATITMAPAALIGATSYNDAIKTNFSHPSRMFRASRSLRWRCHTHLAAPPRRTIIRTRRSSMRTSFRVRSQAR